MDVHVLPFEGCALWEPWHSFIVNIEHVMMQAEGHLVRLTSKMLFAYNQKQAKE